MSDHRRYFGPPFDLDPWGRPRQAIDPRSGRPPRRDPYGQPIEPVPQASDEGEHVRQLEAEVTSLREQLEQASQDSRALTVRAHEAEAELENAKHRIQREAAREVEQRKRSILGELLEVLDDLDRAIAAGRGSGGERGLLQGVELVRQRFLRKLEQLGVEHDPAAGQAFDPQRHEAVSSVPVTDPDRRGRVVAVLREGYRIGDQLLRPAHVAVGV